MLKGPARWGLQLRVFHLVKYSFYLLGQQHGVVQADDGFTCFTLVALLVVGVVRPVLSATKTITSAVKLYFRMVRAQDSRTKAEYYSNLQPPSDNEREVLNYKKDRTKQNFGGTKQSFGAVLV